jgi:hypothetical protein
MSFSSTNTRRRARITRSSTSNLEEPSNTDTEQYNNREEKLATKGRNRPSSSKAFLSFILATFLASFFISFVITSAPSNSKLGTNDASMPLVVQNADQMSQSSEYAEVSSKLNTAEKQVLPLQENRQY